MAVRVPLTLAGLMLTLSTVSGTESVHPLEYSPHLDDYPNQITHGNIAFRKSQSFDVTLRKCRCDGHQIWDGSRCKDSQTFVVMLDPETGLTSVVSTNKLDSVMVGEPACPIGHSLAILDSNRNSDDQFCLLVSGNLYWQEVEFIQYCIDHTLDEEGRPWSWEAHVCLPSPQVPRCCAKGHALAADDCTGLTNQIFSPPITVDEVPLKWQEYEGEIADISCTDPEEMHRLRLSPKEASLVYQSGNASVVWSSSNSQKREQQQNYCVGIEVGTEDYVVKLCYHDPCAKATCVRKCCPEAQLIDGFSCAPVRSDSEVWEPSFYEADGLTPISPPEDLRTVYGFPCQSVFPLEPDVHEDDKFFLSIDGFLYVASFSEPYPSDSYCLDHFRSEGFVQTQALVCFPEELQDPQCIVVARNYLYPSLLLVSCVFLCLTLVLYASLPELHQKLHGKCLLSLVSMLLLAYLTLAITRLATAKIPPGLCRFMASVMHWSFLAAFFWLNVMCFDIWRSLSMMRTVSRGARKTRKRFRLFSLYAWGCSFLITIVAVIMEVLPDTYHVIRPNFSDKTCWFQNTSSLWVYLYGFVLAMVVLNIIFFGMVAYILIRSRNNSDLRRSSTHTRERFWLCVKLFLVMGVTWVTEVISWQEGSCQAWIFLDIVNSLQGFSIFLVFVCKKANLNKMRGSCGGCCGREKLDTSSITFITGVKTTTSSSAHHTSSNSMTRGSLKPQGSLATSLIPQPDNQVIIPLSILTEANQPSGEDNHHEDRPVSSSHSDGEMPLGEQRGIPCGISTADETTVTFSHISSEVREGLGNQHNLESGDETTTEATPLRANESTTPPKESHF
ncbi:uncharacterized protein [Panulirus ornatus]|uniref:uncharacterized protein n=1 Tax=Panulirus ornatus TaxID=150431 RepID=UPI003A8BFFF3